jgi:hypothetical protein
MPEASIAKLLPIEPAKNTAPGRTELYLVVGTSSRSRAFFRHGADERDVTA